MSINSANLSITAQTHADPAATIEIDEDMIARSDVHRELFTPGRSELPEGLAEAVATITAAAPGQSGLADRLQQLGVDALEGHYALSAAKVAVDLERGSRGRPHWFEFLQLSRTIWQHELGSMDDVYAGPVALLAQLEHQPTIEVRFPADFISEFKQTQRVRLLGYLRRLTPGVDVRITGSRLALRRLLEHHAADLPGDVTASAQATLTDSSQSDREPERVAQAAIEEIGLGDPQESIWRLLTRVCDDSDPRVAQVDLQDDLLVDLDSSTVRKYAARLDELGLVERPTWDGRTHLRPTAAGQAALSQAQDQAPTLVSGWSTATHQADTAVAEDGEMAGVNHPPKSISEPCTPNAHEGEEGGDRPTAEGRQAAAGGSSVSPPETGWLAMHEHHAAVSAAPEDGGIGLEKRQLSGSGDDRAVRWSCNSDDQQVVAEATMGRNRAVDMVRLCTALFNEKAEREVLTPENLNGGPGKFNLEGLDNNNPYVLRKGRTLGWLRNQDAEGGRFLDRLRRARNNLLEECAEAAEAAENGIWQDEDLQRILRKAHGLQAVLVAVYDLLGYDVVRKIQVPDPWNADVEALAHTILHQTSCSSRRGLYTVQRVLYEPRQDKRDDALGAPVVDVDDYHGTVVGSWVIESPQTEPLRDALENPDEYGFELQKDKENYSDIVLDLDVVDANRREAVAEAAARLLPENLRPERSMITLLHSMTGSTAAAAAAIQALGAPDEPRHLDHGDLEHGLLTMVDSTRDSYTQFGPDDLLPEIGGRTVSKVVAALLRRDEKLSTSAVAEAADVSTQSIRDNREEFVLLEELGLLDVDHGGPGCADQWSFSFPGAGDWEITGETDAAPESLAAEIFGEPPWGGAEWRIEEAIHEYLIAIGDRGYDLPVSLGDPVVIEATSGPPEQRDLSGLLETFNELRPALALLADLCSTALPTGSAPLTVRMGDVPDAAAQQQSISTAAAD